MAPIEVSIFKLTLPKNWVLQQHKTVPALGLTVARTYDKASGQAFVVLQGLNPSMVNSMLLQLGPENDNQALQQQINWMIGLLSGGASPEKQVELTELTTDEPSFLTQSSVRQSFHIRFKQGNKFEKEYRGELWWRDLSAEKSTFLVISYHEPKQYQATILSSFLQDQSFSSNREQGLRRFPLSRE